MTDTGSRLVAITGEQARRAAHATVASLAPLSEAEAWQAAQDATYGLLTDRQRDALDDLDRLDFLMTGRSRGCHYGACNDRVIDTGWRED